MKKNKSMAQEIWKALNLYPKTSKKLYHYKKSGKGIINRLCKIAVFLLCCVQECLIYFIDLFVKYKFSIKTQKVEKHVMNLNK